MLVTSHEMRLGRKWMLFLCIITLLGLALRFASVYLGYTTVLDPERYENQSGFEIWARSMLHGYGHGYGPNQRTAAMPPMPAVLVLFVYYLFGEHNYLAVWLYKAFFGTLTIIFTALLGKEAFNEKVGLYAAGIVALYPEIIFVNTHLHGYLPETFLLFFITLTLYFFGRFMRTTSLIELLFAGIGLGIAMLTYPSIWSFPILVLILFFFAYPRRQAVKFSAILTAVTLITVSPWLIRNYVIYGHFISCTNVAYGLFMGNNPQTQPHAYDTEKITGPGSPAKIWASMGGADPKLTRGAYGWGKDEYKRYQAAINYAIKFIFSNPVLFVQRGLGKVLDFWGSERSFVAFYRDGYYGKNLPTRLMVVLAAAIMLSYSVVFLLGWLGIIFVAKSPFRYLLILIVLSPTLGSFVGLGHPKYHLAIIPVMAVFASWGLMNRWHIIQSIKSSKISFLIALVPLFCLLLIWGREVMLGDFNKFFSLLK